MALIKVKNSELEAIKDQTMILDGGQRSEPVTATGNDGKPLMRQMDMQPVVLHTFGKDHVKWKILNSGKVRYDLARSLKNVESAIRELDKKRTDMIDTGLTAQKGDEKYPNKNELAGEYAIQFHKAYREELNKEVEIDIRQVEIAHLNVEENSIPISVLSTLLDIVIKDNDSHDKK